MILSIDDGCASDVRVAELAKKYNIETIFYWPVEWHSLAFEKGYEPLGYADALKIASEFEIGSHTITHRYLTNIPFEEARYEIECSKFMLEDMLTTDITKFCPPRGYTNPELNKIIMGSYESQRLTKGKGLLHIHPNSGANGNIPWREYYAQHKDQITEVWGHSWEMDKYDLWGEFEEFLKEVSNGQ